ncbi:MAG: RNA polymerase-binding protein DksA [Burkholderiaceae bacterium]|nr:RNA polymerase-binding protein DksA [Burkholderiaceae bacterium]
MKKIASKKSVTVKPAASSKLVAKKPPVKKATGATTAKTAVKASAKVAVKKAAAAKPVTAKVQKTPARKPASKTARNPAPPKTQTARRAAQSAAPNAKPAAPVSKKIRVAAPARKAKTAARPLTVPLMLAVYSMPPRVIAVAHPVQIKKDPRLINNWKTKPIEQWSDDEVIAMPDEEYMNVKQLAFFRLRLLTLKNDLLNNAGETTENLRGDTVVVPDPADRATIEEEHALELRTRDRERKLLKKIEQSIARIDAGDYGYCDETGEPIGVARLLARPTATLSLEAQQRRELKQKLFGD